MTEETTEKPTISFEDFMRLDLRVAKVLEVADHPNADRLYVLQIDMGGERRQVVAGLKAHCPPESLLGRNIVVVANLEPRKLRGMESRGMLLAASYEQDGQEKVVILTTDQPVPSGATVG